jgi:hypothetical protein
MAVLEMYRDGCEWTQSEFIFRAVNKFSQSIFGLVMPRTSFSVYIIKA